MFHSEAAGQKLPLTPQFPLEIKSKVIKKMEVIFLRIPKKIFHTRFSGALLTDKSSVRAIEMVLCNTNVINSINLCYIQ